MSGKDLNSEVEVIMNYKSDSKVKSVRVDYLLHYEDYDESYIDDLDYFARSIQHHINSSDYKVFEIDTNNNETLIVDTSKIVSVRIAYK